MPDHPYMISGPEPFQPPNYQRVVESLSDEALLDEITMKRGDPGYQAALAAELRKRASRPRE